MSFKLKLSSQFHPIADSSALCVTESQQFFLFTLLSWALELPNLVTNLPICTCTTIYTPCAVTPLADVSLFNSAAVLKEEKKKIYIWNSSTEPFTEQIFDRLIPPIQATHFIVKNSLPPRGNKIGCCNWSREEEDICNMVVVCTVVALCVGIFQIYIYFQNVFLRSVRLQLKCWVKKTEKKESKAFRVGRIRQ